MLYCTSDFGNIPKVLVVKIIVHPSHLHEEKKYEG